MQRFAGEHSTNEATVIARLKKFDLSGLELPYRELVSWLSRNYQDIYFVNPRRVEEIVRDVLREAINVELAMTTQSRDGGIDLIGLEGDKKLIVEVKRYAKSRKIGVRIVRNLAGVLLRENSRRGLIVTTSDFTETSKMEASILAKQDQTYPVEIELRTLDEFIPWLNIVAVKLQGRRESKDYWDRKAIRFVHIPWSI
jgi:restriction endonuclease Mrr